MGQRLFVRAGRRMVPTPLARAFAAEVKLAFDRITAAAEACGRSDAGRILRVSAPTSFAMRWLMPRLDGFHRTYPLSEVAVMTVTTVEDELRNGYDVAIRRGNPGPGAWPSRRATPVPDEVDTVIMSLALFSQCPWCSLLDVEGHLMVASETRPGDWADWLETAGLSHFIIARRQLFDHFFIIRQAVEDGLGIGVGTMPILGIDGASGRLITLLPQIRVRRTGYVALEPTDGDEIVLQQVLSRGSWPNGAAAGRTADELAYVRFGASHISPARSCLGRLRPASPHGEKRNGGFQADSTYCGRLSGKDRLACGRERDGLEAPLLHGNQLWRWTGEAGSRYLQTKSIGPVAPDTINVPPLQLSGRAFT